MSVERVSHLEVLARFCERHGLALLLVASHTPAGFAHSSSTKLTFLDVFELADGLRGQRSLRIRAGDLCIRADLALVDGDLEAAAELLVGLLTRTRRAAA